MTQRPAATAKIPRPQKLNSDQLEAVNCVKGPLLILAGAGSGKTTVLVSRTQKILELKLARPEEVVVLTFTNKAARELKDRVAQAVPNGKKLVTGTFHAFGLNFLKKHHKLAGLPARFGVIDDADSRFIIKDLLRDKKHDSKSDYDPEIILKVIQDLRLQRSHSPTIDETYLEMGEWLYPDYMKRMTSLGVVDFDGLILTPTKLLRENPELKIQYHSKIKFLMVDEFQDTNAMQMDLVKELINPEENIAVVGDDDQSIYGWRGAEIKNILSFPKLFNSCQVVRLETNYRSTPEIINLANSVINKNTDRHTKTLKPHSKSKNGDKPEVYVFEDENKECEEVVNLVRRISKNEKLSDIAVLYRSNAQGGVLEGLLKQSRIPYDLTGGPNLMDRKEVRDALAYIKAAITPDDLSLRRIVNLPPRGVGDVTIEKILNYQEDHEIGFLRALRAWDKIEITPRVGSSIEDFLDSLKKLRSELIKKDTSSYVIRLKKYFSEVGLKDHIFLSYKDSKTAQKKWELIEILGRILDSFLSNARDTKNRDVLVKDFLDTMMLRDTDAKDDGEAKLQMLTLHASKGLEFPVVILMGVDEGLIPHEKLGHDVSEERRLFYVGVTRAKTSLIMTRASHRKRYGKRRETSATRFLVNLPDDLYNTYENGFKPVSETQRKDMLADLYKSLDLKIGQAK